MLLLRKLVGETQWWKQKPSQPPKRPSWLRFCHSSVNLGMDWAEHYAAASSDRLPTQLKSPVDLLPRWYTACPESFSILSTNLRNGWRNKIRTVNKQVYSAELLDTPRHAQKRVLTFVHRLWRRSSWHHMPIFTVVAFWKLHIQLQNKYTTAMKLVLILMEFGTKFTLWWAQELASLEHVRVRRRHSGNIRISSFSFVNLKLR